MKGEVFEILPGGERRSIGKILSITYGGHPARITDVVIEIGHVKAPEILSAKFQATSTGVICIAPTKPPRNHYERMMARRAQEKRR